MIGQNCYLGWTSRLKLCDVDSSSQIDQSGARWPRVITLAVRKELCESLLEKPQNSKKITKTTPKCRILEKEHRLLAARQILAKTVCARCWIRKMSRNVCPRLS